MTGSHIATLKDQLLGRDFELLVSVDKYRLLSTRQIQRLHFDHAHPTPVAAARACNRTLVRLRGNGVLRALERRIGGARAGSAGSVWYVGPAGDRLLRDVDPEARSGRRNYREPSRHFVEHMLAIAELAIQVVEASRRGAVEVLRIDTEPASWEQSLSRHGVAQWLKPDLRLVTATAEEEYHWFVEADLATEHLPVILRQCSAYQAFRATGRYQAVHGVFPAILWVTPTPGRAAAIRAAVAAGAAPGGLDAALFQVCTADEFRAIATDLAREGA